MAEQLGVSYSTLTHIWSAERMTESIAHVMERLLHYCMVHKIPMDTVLESY